MQHNLEAYPQQLVRGEAWCYLKLAFRTYWLPKEGLTPSEGWMGAGKMDEVGDGLGM